VVNVDPRGAFASEGDVQWMSPLEAQDGYDVVEWVAAQDWCADAVTMAGNSWLAVMQWKIAATCPPHLAAIAPWEGFTDLYRDFVLPGGIPHLFGPEIITVMNAGRGRAEDLPAMVRKYPFMNDYWRGKMTDVEAITVPAYVVASWTNVYHTRGTLDAFTRLDPTRSWLRVHNTMEWPDQYEYEGDLLTFFDHVIKGKDNGWDRTPRVRLSVLDPGGEDQVNRPEETYPLTRAQETPLYLEAGSRTLTRSPLTEGTSVDYDAPGGMVAFDYTVDRDVELVGPMKLRLWLETEAAYDADVFVYVRKADAEGNPRLATIPPGLPWQGAHGRLRATHRELDPERSTPLCPVHTHERPLPVQPGEAVPLDIAIWPFGMAWHAGQRLQVVVSGHDLAVMHPMDAVNINSGVHRIRTGGWFDSHLLVPVATGQVI
jgi:predicted acyl esterase